MSVRAGLESLARGALRAKDALPSRSYFSGGVFKEQRVSSKRLDVDKHDWTWYDGSAHPFPVLWLPEQHGVSSSWFLKGLALAFSGPAFIMYFGYQTRKDNVPAFAPYFSPEDPLPRRKINV